MINIGCNDWIVNYQENVLHGNMSQINKLGRGGGKEDILGGKFLKN